MKPTTIPDPFTVTAKKPRTRRPAAPPAPAPERRPRPAKPTRITVDLDRAHHQFLRTYTAQIEARSAAEVVRALLDELREDPQLAERIRARIWR